MEKQNINRTPHQDEDIAAAVQQDHEQGAGTRVNPGAHFDLSGDMIPVFLTRQSNIGVMRRIHAYQRLGPLPD